MISGYSSFTPGSHVKVGQQYGKGAVLFVFSVSNLHLSLANGNGPQSSTNSSNLQIKKSHFVTGTNTYVYYFLLYYLAGFSSFCTQVERPQNGVKSQVLPGSTVVQRVEAKHMPGKSVKKKIKIEICL